jgi:hypothetical protein
MRRKKQAERYLKAFLEAPNTVNYYKLLVLTDTIQDDAREKKQEDKLQDIIERQRLEWTDDNR